MGTTALPSELPELFSYTDARRHGLSDRQLRNLNDQGAIEKIGRGLFSTTTLDADPDLIEAAFRDERATICLTRALARHELTDEIPASFDLGREDLDVGAGYRIGLYSAERSICDAFRLRHLEGSEQAIEALKRWLRRPGSQPSQLLALAAEMGPKASEPIRSALQILL